VQDVGERVTESRDIGRLSAPSWSSLNASRVVPSLAYNASTGSTSNPSCAASTSSSIVVPARALKAQVSTSPAGLSSAGQISPETESPIAAGDAVADVPLGSRSVPTWAHSILPKLMA
jgi:hypothetical protein